MTKGCVEIDLVSLHNPKVKLPVKAYVLEKLTAPLPTEKINEAHFSHLKNACLADPKFFIPSNIDMILGSDYFFSILLPGSSDINSTSLTFSETQTAEETIIRWVQGIHFQEEIQSIKKQISLPPISPLRSLHPFIDEHGLVQVGGRLQNFQLRFNSKHPIILPSQHTISELLIKEQHIAHLHAGPTLLAHVLRQSHWIVGSRKLINKCIRKCLKCNKFKISTTTRQLMGNLPKHRVTLERPFFSCGIDYAGPVLIKCNKGRWTKSAKGYIALFVCLTTKAVHIEAVGDLTTDSFIAALRRFSARRGAHHHIYCDNGTNFVGARDVLLSVPEELPSTSNHRDRWELLQNLKRGFWKKWSSDFLSSLQPRKKWQDAQPNLKEDDIVLIKEEVHGQWLEFLKCIQATTDWFELQL
ncbi:integrase catalytic domain-containing protein [Trichonephila inaurata madagascariensis]|uniref:Integrase catalytic domain-containing protein n=1 Tax=Trichonephila inaurata madagascariensis TaxID=2747483 RepID=A0A8X6I694_9ARAC|nr:integrase catalytic domain-containing protein [Trichonephila inaurata madagascariensis]